MLMLTNPYAKNADAVIGRKVKLGGGGGEEGEDQYWLLGLRHCKRPAAKNQLGSNVSDSICEIYTYF